MTDLVCDDSRSFSLSRELCIGGKQIPSSAAVLQLVKRRVPHCFVSIEFNVLI